jgi:hypothetical protein
MQRMVHLSCNCRTIIPRQFIPGINMDLQPCNLQTNCFCYSKLSEEQKDHLISKFKIFRDVAKQKQFIYGMLSLESDDDGYERCFQISEGIFLCRLGLVKALKFSRRQAQRIVPSNPTISHRYRLQCISLIFNALVSYRSSYGQDNTSNVQLVQWSSSPCFAEAIKKVNRIPAYCGVKGISTLVSHLGITKAIRNGQIILGAIGHQQLDQFLGSIGGQLIDLTCAPQYNTSLDALYQIIDNLSPRSWNRVNKISLSYSQGGQIEYTSSPADSLLLWANANSKTSSGNNSRNTYLQLLENHIQRNISQFVFSTHEHSVRLQPGALRSPIGTVPQRAHRDISRRLYHDRFPGQIFIGFMPVSRDGMFIQVWDGPGEAKLLFIPYGSFLLLPGQTIHGGWMCTSPEHLNYRLHFYVLVSKEPATQLSRTENFYFENMNNYFDEESHNTNNELHHSYYTALSGCQNFLHL